MTTKNKTTIEDIKKEIKGLLDDYANFVYYEGDPRRCEGTTQKVIIDFILSKFKANDKKWKKKIESL